MKSSTLRLLAPLALCGFASAQASTFCFGTGANGPCPCANTGINGRGCENSATTGGGELSFQGTTNPDTVKLSASHMLAGVTAIFVQGDALVAPAVPFGDGLRCTGGVLKRLYVKTASATGDVDAPEINDGDSPIRVRSEALGSPIAPGSTRYYQTYYRDPSPTFCPAPAGNTFNVTSGIIVTW
jgi:hypothetical protein